MLNRPMPVLALKLVLTPVLIAAASLAGRRWGPAIGGWLVALPLTSGPVALFLVLDQGAGFAAAAAVGSLLGALAEAGFALAYARMAARGWLVALVAGTVAFAIVALTVGPVSTLDRALVFVVVLAGLGVTLRVLPARTTFDEPATLPSWDLPVRVVLGTSVVVAITASAALLGPALSGLLAAYPVFAALLAVFAHRDQGAAAAVDVLHGLVLGLTAFAVFFVTLGWGLARLAPAPAFAVAIGAALLTHGLVLWRLTRARGGDASPPGDPAASAMAAMPAASAGGSDGRDQASRAKGIG